MRRSWTDHLKTKKEKDEFKKRVAYSSDVLDRLRAILEKDLAASIKEAAKEENYSLPSWSCYQADKLGEQRTLRKVIDILPKQEKE